MLGVPFYVWDVAEQFERDVIDDFVAEYAAGRTPNPCVRCNERIKFAAVLDRARALGFDAVCTGHYARTDGVTLRRAVDASKDQSYVLAVLTARQLAASMFPLGDSVKADVRAEAARRGLGVADKPDSHDICFIADGDTQGWLTSRLGAQPGPVVDAVTGDVVGAHAGAFAYTVGQRRGLSLQQRAADGRPRYVLAVEPVTRTVRVGPAEHLAVERIVAGRPSWCGASPDLPFAGVAQVRAHGEAHPCSATVVDDQLVVSFDGDRPSGVAPGQTVVLYDADRVVGSATIDATQ